MKRLVLLAAAAATLALSVPANAWPPVCKEPVYTLLDKCV